METIMGICGPDFVMIAADTTQSHSIIVMKTDANKIHKLSNNLIMAIVGDSGDTIKFTDFIARNMDLYKIQHGYDLSTKSAAHFIRKNLADFLRTHFRFRVNMLLAGCAPNEEPTLYYLDNFGSSKSGLHFGLGYGGMFCTSIFDRYYRKGITKEEAYDVLKKCVAVVQKRLVINLPKFNVSVVDKDGIRELPQITAQNLIGYKP